jgi:hypothetical protein
MAPAGGEWQRPLESQHAPTALRSLVRGLSGGSLMNVGSKGDTCVQTQSCHTYVGRLFSRRLLFHFNDSVPARGPDTYHDFENRR